MKYLINAALLTKCLTVSIIFINISKFYHQLTLVLPVRQYSNLARKSDARLVFRMIVFNSANVNRSFE